MSVLTIMMITGHLLAELPLTTFLGRAVYVDFKETVAKRGHITAADLDREAGKVKEGDIVIIDSSYKLYPFTPDTNTDKDQRLLVGAESAEWFKAHKVKAVGFGDGVSIENCNEDVKPFHDIFNGREYRIPGSVKKLRAA